MFAGSIGLRVSPFLAYALFLFLSLSPAYPPTLLRTHACIHTFCLIFPMFLHSRNTHTFCPIFSIISFTQLSPSQPTRRRPLLPTLFLSLLPYSFSFHSLLLSIFFRSQLLSCTTHRLPPQCVDCFIKNNKSRNNKRVA